MYAAAMSMVGPDDIVQIAGAGPAGLAAAITLARAGGREVAHEAHPIVGYRFQRDLQGLENRTSEEDVLCWTYCGVWKLQPSSPRFPAGRAQCSTPEAWRKKCRARWVTSAASRTRAGGSPS